ncbi:DUF58 domain-containing protein [Tenuifilum sp.]|uniref:DUF58 domain-containing protein n=1 Tax=Tenuifilum sp. TaxID=2760880 RepID=UPI001B6AA43C|nr:DUF58 domain-containing protein [Bacteroidales bacterium]HOK60315.1 DUF58 domain-containing protein [Tenuifilum sp.]HOK86321.1 DUF58 domain-containing protein [Tenuifilum sp.]HPP89433.1 DUF58 domain-containing protein [Tenuifilum sp.]
METAELLKKVRRIEIKTRGLTRQIFAGQYHSAFKGRGMAFSEVREYRVGDDIRSIDWNVTARYNQPYVKVFEEERELTVMLLIDVSGSQNFGSTQHFKRHVIAEVAAVLAFSAIQNNDKIGVILFSDKVEKFIPPQKGSKHILRIISELLNFEPSGKETNIAEALRFLTNAIKKRSTAFVLSDFIDFNEQNNQPRFTDAISIANNKHDVVAIRIYDDRETQLPSVGLVRFTDAETGNDIWIDTANKLVQNHYSQWWNITTENLKQTFTKAKVDWVSVRTDEDYVKPLMLLFKRRSK